MAKRIGIPRVLWYYDDYPDWDIFFQSLGLEVTVSEATSRATLDSSLNFAEEELCLPAKIAFGHILNLKQKNPDFIFLPYLVSKYKNHYFCPNFAGLPDMIRNNIKNLPQLIDPIVDVNKKALSATLREIAGKFTKNSTKTKEAIKKSLILRKIAPAPDERDKLKIALVGHSYIIEDSFINMNIKDKLNKLGAQVYLPGAQAQLNEEIKSLNWEFIKKLHAGLISLLKNSLEGVIHISSFGCGPDSLSGEIFRAEARRFKVPFLELVIDEHTTELAFDTRIEAFCDMLQRKKK